MEIGHLDPARPVRRRITFGLAGAGAAAGALVGVAPTVLGEIVAGAPPADAANHLWNAGVFGAIGACLAPVVAWSSLRQVPLRRTIADPLGARLRGVPGPSAYDIVYPQRFGDPVVAAFPELPT